MNAPVVTLFLVFGEVCRRVQVAVMSNQNSKELPIKLVKMVGAKMLTE